MFIISIIMSPNLTPLLTFGLSKDVETGTLNVISLLNNNLLGNKLKVSGGVYFNKPYKIIKATSVF